MYSLYKGGLVEDMASKQLYPCFACRKAGHEVQVFLDGKDEQGRTKYLNEDGSKHTHLGSSFSSQQQQQGSTAVVTEPPTTSLKIINAKLDRIIALLTESQTNGQSHNR